MEVSQEDLQLFEHRLGSFVIKFQQDPLGSTGVTGDNRKGRFGNTELFCKKFNAHFVGGSFNRRGSEFDFQCIAINTGDAVF